MHMDPLPPGLSWSNRKMADQLWGSLVAQQINLIDKKTEIFGRILDETEKLEEQVDRSKQDINDLGRELAIWKKAYMQDVEKGKEEVKTLKKRLADLEGLKDRDPMVLVLVDGDGCIFEDELLKRGLEGGRQAAQMLNENIMTCISNEDKSGLRVQVWTYIFSNLKGLQRRLVSLNICTGNEFEAFVMGFNQANPRFTINDVHCGKEAADAKIKAYLYTWSRIPQTLKIFFGGGHDNGYHPTLAELQSDGILDKITLLQGYKQVATEIRSFNLPTLNIERLFRLEKLPSVKPIASPRTLPSLLPIGGSPKLLYTSAVATGHPVPQTLRLSPASASATSLMHERRRHPDPNVELHKHVPPPCNMFYLSNNCSKGVDCKYSHEYILEPHHYKTLAENARKSPCPAINGDLFCSRGDDCLLGHKCPNGPQCYHRKLGRCWFKGKSMHN